MSLPAWLSQQGPSHFKFKLCGTYLRSSAFSLFFRTTAAWHSLGHKASCSLVVLELPSMFGARQSQQGRRRTLFSRIRWAMRPLARADGAPIARPSRMATQMDPWVVGMHEASMLWLTL